MIRPDTYQIHTPEGRYERRIHDDQPSLECGHQPNTDRSAWTRVRQTTQNPTLPATLCTNCMAEYFENFTNGSASE